MAEGKRMPQLTMDEVLLLVDAYFQIENLSEVSLKKDIIQELSDSMRSLPFFPELKDSPAFRSTSGMSMCLSNVAYVDPNKANSAFGHGSALQKRVFDHYKDNRNQLHSIANAIKSISRLDFPMLPQYEDCIVGKLLPSYLEHIERTNKVVKNARKVVLQNGKTCCSICGVDLSMVYPENFSELLDAHIAIPVSTLNGEECITLSDVIFLCPTCHRLSHAQSVLLEPAKLKELVKGR